MPRGRVRQRGGRARAGRPARANRNADGQQNEAGGQQNEAERGNNHPNTRGQKRRADDLEHAERTPPRGPAEPSDIDDGGNILLQENADVWVLGDSIPFWAGKRAADTGKPNLSLPDITIAWWGISGLRWTSFRHSVQTQVLLSSPPRAIILHLGGNDLTSLSSIELRELIETEVKYLRDAFPETIIIWVDILPRRVWRGACNLKAIDVKRKRINRSGRIITSRSGRSDIVSPDIDTATNFFRSDGVHLNEVGLEFYLYYLKSAIIKNLCASQ
ncbi:uncharacterized protein LOC123547335 [Mercenaria mercenaria]|uniref:uncharacterized protein LOC123547335 n=1 Tax=Mercenaria mercenaria TaxID=6596 RepID=UPI001E1D8C75|nr:uncharacterized protein LOC123547335 [Mercenaria mercenaria]